MVDVDKSLVQAARRGDADAWDALFRAHQLPLYVFVLKMVRHDTTALDIVQETFIAATRYLGSLKDDGLFLSWMFSIARQKCAAQWRRDSRNPLANPAGDGEAAFTTHSKVSGDELARPVANGGSSLPTIGHWLDELNVARVLRLLDPVEQTQKWTYFVLQWAAERIGVWGARAATGPAPNKATLAVSQFLTRYKEATNVLTSSKFMPAHWQARFRSFFRAMH